LKHRIQTFARASSVDNIGRARRNDVRHMAGPESSSNSTIFKASFPSTTTPRLVFPLSLSHRPSLFQPTAASESEQHRQNFPSSFSCHERTVRYYLELSCSLFDLARLVSERQHTLRYALDSRDLATLLFGTRSFLDLRRSEQCFLGSRHST
jgi:hypothetical protein